MTTSIPILNTTTAPASDADVLVLGLTNVGEDPTLVGTWPELVQAWEAAFPQDLLTTATTLGARSKLGTVAVLPPLQGQRIIVVGLGEVDVTPAAVRHAAGTALRTIAGIDGAEGWKVTVCLELNDPELAQAAAEGALLGAYRRPRVSDDERPLPVGEVDLLVGQEAVAETASVAGIIAAAVAQARDWINTPPNLLFPESFAEAGKKLLADHKVAVEILDEKALAKGGYGGLLAVGGGSSRAPRLLRLAWAPKGAKFHLALVGKGITFDSGGLDIKPAGQMAAMTSDMSGAAAVIAATWAIAALGLPITVTTYAAMAENLPSGSAYRSSDVLTMFDGSTVENGNTDAEGRLVMADALGRATKDEPDLIVDVATLTGACMVALGTRTAGLMASDDATADQVLDAAESADEAFWHLPITEDLRESLTSDVADLRSTGKSRWGGALTAAAFLQHFVGETPWAHLDIAGPAFNEDAPWGCTPKGGTGVAVRTLIALASNLAG